MKKWLIMVGALMLVLALSACSGESSSSDGALIPRATTGSDCHTVSFICNDKTNG